jgi:hypothetical protein
LAGLAGQPSAYSDGGPRNVRPVTGKSRPDSPECTDVFFAEYVFIDLLRFAQTAVATPFFVQ